VYAGLFRAINAAETHYLGAPQKILGNNDNSISTLFLNYDFHARLHIELAAKNVMHLLSYKHIPVMFICKALQIATMCHKLNSLSPCLLP